MDKEWTNVTGFAKTQHNLTKKNKEGERRMKGIAMAQWVNHLLNNIFVNPPPLPLLCEISGALHLVQPGLMTGWQADKIQVNFENYKIGCRLKYSSFASFNQDTASL